MFKPFVVHLLRNTWKVPQAFTEYSSVGRGDKTASGLPAIDRYLSNYVEGMPAFGAEAKYGEMIV